MTKFSLKCVCKMACYSPEGHRGDVRSGATTPDPDAGARENLYFCQKLVCLWQNLSPCAVRLFMGRGKRLMKL